MFTETFTNKPDDSEGEYEKEKEDLLLVVCSWIGLLWVVVGGRVYVRPARKRVPNWPG